MRLLCVNNKPVSNSFNLPDALAAIKEGEVYEGYQVQGETPDGTYEYVWKIPSLFEKKGYAIERFIPLPDTTADEVEEEQFIYDQFSC